MTNTTLGDTLVMPGGALKSLDGGGRYGGLLVVFGDHRHHDSSSMKDYFTPATDFDIEDGARTAVYYNHGLDPTLKARKLGCGTLTRHHAGVWLEMQLKARDEYERGILALIEDGKLGLSSGTAAHLVERKAVGGGVHEVLRWPLGLDASLTPTPAEPRATAHCLKTLIEYASGLPAAPPAGRSLVDHSRQVLDACGDFTERIRELIALRQGRGGPGGRGGRALSEMNYQRLAAHRASLKKLGDNLDQLLAAHAPLDKSRDVQHELDRLLVLCASARQSALLDA